MSDRILHQLLIRVQVILSSLFCQSIFLLLATWFIMLSLSFLLQMMSVVSVPGLGQYICFGASRYFVYTMYSSFTLMSCKDSGLSLGMTCRMPEMAFSKWSISSGDCTNLRWARIDTTATVSMMSMEVFKLKSRKSKVVDKNCKLHVLSACFVGI